MKVAVVIPARLGSHRFPRKVLARDTGKYLIQHVYERVADWPGVDRVILATDSEEVEAAARAFGADVAQTRASHVSGTDRVAEVAEGLSHEIIINVQGDEPNITHEDLDTLLELFEKPCGARGRTGRAVMTTLAVERTDPEGFKDPNVVKAVFGTDGYALYFSRSRVPYPRTPTQEGPWSWFQHVGVYAYRREFLLELTKFPPTPIEGRERLEQLRVLENGYDIRVGLSKHAHRGIDTVEEYRAFVEEYSRSAAASSK